MSAAGAGQSAYATAGIGAAAVAGLTGVGEAYLSTKISQSIVATLRRQFSGRLLDQPVGSFTDRRAGDLLSRINCSARPRAPG